VCAQYERFKKQEETKRNWVVRFIRAFPVCAACIGLRNRGINAYNESEVLNKEHAVKGVEEVDDRQRALQSGQPAGLALALTSGTSPCVLLPSEPVLGQLVLLQDLLQGYLSVPAPRLTQMRHHSRSIGSCFDHVIGF
jgi:hypothetical protein